MLLDMIFGIIDPQINSFFEIWCAFFNAFIFVVRPISLFLQTELLICHNPTHGCVVAQP